MWILRCAKQQNVPIEVYIRQVPDEVYDLHGVPVALLHGWELGLIRTLDPEGNRAGRSAII
jgi:hypothetical protein